jgi:hypothetical protein
MEFLLKNKLWVGLVLGAIIPFVGYATFLSLNEFIFENGNFGAGGDKPIFDKNSLLLFAVCLNLIPFTIYQRRRLNKSMRGVLGTTLIYAMVWLYWFGTSF